MKWSRALMPSIGDTLRILVLSIFVAWLYLQYSYAFGWCPSQEYMHNQNYIFVVFVVILTTLWIKNAGVVPLAGTIFTLCLLSGVTAALCEGNVMYDSVFDAIWISILIFAVFWLEAVVFYIVTKLISVVVDSTASQ